MGRKGQVAWNKGLIKETDKRVAKYSNSQKGKKYTEEFKKKLSIIHKKIFHPTVFKKGHIVTKKMREKMSLSKKGMYLGEKHPNWKGGKTIDKSGYILVLKPKHPLANNLNYVREHRLVMEKYLGRHLKPQEVVHHINNNPSDNRIENLKLFINESEHQKFHHSN